MAFGIGQTISEIFSAIRGTRSGKMAAASTKKPIKEKLGLSMLKDQAMARQRSEQGRRQLKGLGELGKIGMAKQGIVNIPEIQMARKDVGLPAAGGYEPTDFPSAGQVAATNIKTRSLEKITDKDREERAQQARYDAGRPGTFGLSSIGTSKFRTK